MVVGEKWWEILVGWEGKFGARWEGNFHQFLEVWRHKKSGFFVKFVEIMVKIIPSSSTKHRYCKFSIFASW